MLLFISIFFGINVLANWYIFSRLFAFFHLKSNLILWLLVAAFSISYIAAMMLDRSVGFFLSRWLLKLAALWMGVGLILLMCLGLHDLIRLIVPIPQAISRYIVLTGAAALILYSLLNARAVQVAEVKLPAPMDKTIVQLSDIHVGSVSPAHLRRLVKITNSLDPDLVAITGDLMDPWSGLSDETFSSLNEIKVPIYFIIGNHERYTGLATVTRLVEHTPVIMLRNEMVEWDGIQVIGIDDSDRPDQVERQLRPIRIDPDKYSIVLYHRPVGLEAAAQNGIDLMLSGHTHNGQIFPFKFVVKRFFPLMKGVHQIKDSTLFISTGSGTWGPPMRLGTHTQVVAIKLQKAPG
ncbi:MAG: metallophosphoesterase [Planctomycetaceae bacterium]|nr:metallophosphoesterase [Planctomycetaceae bacterium]